MTDRNTVTVELSHPHGENAVGDRLELLPADAKRLVRAGVAVYATKPDAVEAEGSAGAEKTKRAVRKKAGQSE